jgi:hypothetical protein
MHKEKLLMSWTELLGRYSRNLKKFETRSSEERLTWRCFFSPFKYCDHLMCSSICMHTVVFEIAGVGQTHFHECIIMSVWVFLGFGFETIYEPFVQSNTLWCEKCLAMRSSLMEYNK